jgi:hypothetical protein
VVCYACPFIELLIPAGYIFVVHRCGQQIPDRGRIGVSTLEPLVLTSWQWMWNEWSELEKRANRAKDEVSVGCTP